MLELHGKSATGFEMPTEVVEALGKGKKPPVIVTINGHSYRSSVAVMGGRFLCGVAAIADAKTPETRARRIASALTKRKEG